MNTTSTTVAEVEAFTGGAALICGLLLAARPDGRLLGLPTWVLQDAPFDDWRRPGLLLAGFVGVGHLVAAAVQLRGGRAARWVSPLAGAGLVTFEVVEWRVLGFHPLQAVFMAVGAGVAVAGLATPAGPDDPPRRTTTSDTGDVLDSCHGS